MNFSSFSESISNYMMQDPLMRSLQSGFVLLAFFVLFLLFFALRDILLRTRSFWYQFACIVLVAALPVVGFLIYLLVRPARTIKEREQEEILGVLYSVLMEEMFGDMDDEDFDEDEEDQEDEEDNEKDQEDQEDDDVEDDEEDEEDDDKDVLIIDGDDKDDIEEKESISSHS